MGGRRVHFCFVGDGKWRRRIEADIERRGLTDRFHLTGLLPPEDIPAVMHASDVVVHCSLREGLARALPQAMLAGRPVVSFDVDGAADVVDESTGILLPSKDAKALADAIDTLLGSSELRRRLGAAGRGKCREIFSHHRMSIERNPKPQQHDKKQLFLKNDFHNLLLFQTYCHHTHSMKRNCRRFIARLKYPHQGRESKASNFKTLYPTLVL